MTDIEKILADHALWSRGEGGARADLRGAILSGADLSRAILRGAILSGTDLSGTDLSRADLRRVNLSGAILIRANLSEADLSRANLSRADLSRANLSRANLSQANLSEADLSRAVVREGLALGRKIGHASRGDGYTFHAFESSAGEPFFFAGCRAMLRSEYESHIDKEYPNTAKADATRACLEYVCGLRSDFGGEAQAQEIEEMRK